MRQQKHRDAKDNDEANSLDLSKGDITADWRLQLADGPEIWRNIT